MSNPSLSNQLVKVRKFPRIKFNNCAQGVPSRDGNWDTFIFYFLFSIIIFLNISFGICVELVECSQNNMLIDTNIEHSSLFCDVIFIPALENFQKNFI